LSLNTTDFEYDLPVGLIAQVPSEVRDEARLMCLQRDGGAIAHHVFRELPGLLVKGDLLVVNDTRVIPARFQCRRSTGGRIEGLLVRELSRGHWNVMLRNAGRCRLREILQIDGPGKVEIHLEKKLAGGHWLVRINPANDAVQVLADAGMTPLPPYIHRGDKSQEASDRSRYQTIFASHAGAAAAPTAGLHFTEKVLADLAKAEIELACVTLHVGPGTFAPVKCENIIEHQMHKEWYELPAETALLINRARRQGRRIVAVGTTSVRVLEAAGRSGGELSQASGWTDLFLYPPAEFHVVDALITNFHLPRSTLLMLVAAFCSPGGLGGVSLILKAYQEAIRQGYRFYSYGDAMFIE